MLGERRMEKWRSDIEDYIESIEPGMKEAAKEVKEFARATKEMYDDWSINYSVEDWQKHQEFLSAVKAKTSGEEKQVILRVGSGS